MAPAGASSSTSSSPSPPPARSCSASSCARAVISRCSSRACRSLLARVPEVPVVSVNLQPEHKAVLEGDTEIVLTSQDVLAMPVND